MSLIDCCCSAGPCFYEPWFVNVCGANHSTAATVTATDGVTTITASLVGDQYYFSFPNAGTWTRTFSQSLFTTVTHTAVVTCNPLSPVPQVAALTPIAGYSCGLNSCCPQPGPPYLPIAFPSTLYLNDGFGVVTMTGGGPSASWTGCAMRTAAQGFDCNVTHLGGLGGTTVLYGTVVAGATVPVYFTIGCNSVTVAFARCKTPPDPPNANNPDQCVDGFSSAGTGNCSGGATLGLPAVESCPAPANTCSDPYLHAATVSFTPVLAGFSAAGTNTSTCPSSIAVSVTGSLGGHFWLDGSAATVTEPCGNANQGYAAFQVYGGTYSFSWST